MRDYRIEPTDIRGVGPTTDDHIRDVLGRYVDEDESIITAFHLFDGGSSLYELERRGVGADVLERLREIGHAVSGTGPAYVATRHLTGEIADTDRHDVRIDVEPEPDTDDNGDVDGPQVSPPDESVVADALETIRSEYDDSYPEWIRFINEMYDFVADQPYEADFQPPQVHHKIVRYQRIDAETIMRDDNFTDAHLAALAGYADRLRARADA